MIITTIVLQIICTSVILYHIFKIKDNIDAQLKDLKNLKYLQNHTSQSIDRIEQSLYQIDSIVSDIEDAIEDKRTKFICKTNDSVVELNDTEILNIRPTIDKNGIATLIVNYYDIDLCTNRTLYCNRIDIKTELK